jgi:hypothetical protein
MVGVPATGLSPIAAPLLLLGNASGETAMPRALTATGDHVYKARSTSLVEAGPFFAGCRLLKATRRPAARSVGTG